MASPSTEAPKAKPLAFMERLSPEVYLYRPSGDADSSASPDGPKLILVASWTDASDSHIAKYIIKYQELFPRSQIALIRSATPLFFRPPRMIPIAQKLVPVFKSVFNTGLFPPSRPELLVHIFSNGGSASVASLFQAYAASADEGEDKRIPLHVTIIDSAPSEFAAARLAAFVQVGMSTAMRLITAPFVWLVSYSWQFLVSVGALTDWMGIWGDAHNNKALNNEARRVYIYSKIDKLVDYRTVLSHAAKAEERGFSVQREEFVGSAHVAHARKDEGRYWGIVRNFWYGN
ncbi:Transmembrane protein 53 [Escovopsis weberi]|uniref:Transmembrane protein 53 n=1 Tax=Escovopsis weberi TaxID=150374 RepID=A0A0M8N2Y7_ESCWE|nr:Transmembrane protein 53 [Escovopsis weberi]